MPSSEAPSAALAVWLASSRDRRMSQLAEFVAFPSVSMDSQHVQDCHAAAGWLAQRMCSLGIDNVEVSPTGGLPIVYGDWLHAPGAPTVLVYGHYDVQPVEPHAEWDTDPFTVVVQGDRISGRGTADDKGQILIHLDAVEALLATTGTLPVNLRFVFEGEEESDAEHFDDWVVAHRDQLRSDVAFVSDTGLFEGNIPAITVGLRGLLGFQIDVYGSPVQLHSGSHGGVARNPALALATILNSFLDDNGKIAIAGFYDEVAELSPSAREQLEALPFDDASYLAALGVDQSVGETGRSLLERRGARPTLDVHGIWGGFRGEGLMTVIPASAHAKVSCRLVPNQEPGRIAELVRKHVSAHLPSGVRVEVSSLGQGAPLEVPTDSWVVSEAAAAVGSAFGREPVYVWEGGSIPACEALGRLLEVPVVIMGFTPPNCNTHAPNEWMSLSCYEFGLETVVRFLTQVGVAAQ